MDEEPADVADERELVVAAAPLTVGIFSGTRRRILGGSAFAFGRHLPGRMVAAV